MKSYNAIAKNIIKQCFIYINIRYQKDLLMLLIPYTRYAYYIILWITLYYIMKKSRVWIRDNMSKGNFLFKLLFLILRTTFIFLFIFIYLYLFILSVSIRFILFFLYNELINVIFINNRKKNTYNILFQVIQIIAKFR